MIHAGDDNDNDDNQLIMQDVFKISQDWLFKFLRGHNWVHFAYSPQCTITLNLNFAILKT